MHSATKTIKKLEIGNDAKRPADWGWDTVNLDPTVHPTYKAPANKIPCGDDVYDLIYASHILEHVPYSPKYVNVQKTLAEWARVLKPGGTLMVGVPDCEALCRLYLDSSGKSRIDVMRMIYGGQTSQWDFHQVGFDQGLLGAFLVEAGFGAIERVDEFGIFSGDCTTLEFESTRISLNMKATKL